MSEATKLEKLAERFGDPVFGIMPDFLASITNLNDAFEIIDGVDETRANLEEAASEGSLDPAIAKELFGITGKAAQAFTATPTQRSAYVNKLVAEAADMAHAKAQVMYTFVVNVFRTHLRMHHPDVEDADSWAPIATMVMVT